MSNDQSDKTMLQSITQLINSIGNQGISCDVIVQILSLLCLFCIVNRSQGTLNSISTSIPNASTSPLQKLVGDLMKKDGETSPPPDMLATLLPLLNNPQVKSKLTPTNIGMIMNLVSTLGSSNQEKFDKPESPPHNTPPSPGATSTIVSDTEKDAKSEQEKKELGRYLNWKSNFDTKEV